MFIEKERVNGMSVFQLLKEMSDQRSEQPCCKWNLYLEDYIMLDECNPHLKELWETLLAWDASFRICVDLQCPLQEQVIANQIIGYKDAFKVKEDFKIPYIVYSKYKKEIAFIITNEAQHHYILAKAYYFLLTEPYRIFENEKNNILAFHYDKNFFQNQKELLHAFFEGVYNAGKVQRMLDREQFDDELESYKLAIERSKQMHNEILQTKTTISLEEARKYIQQWYLLKKYCYVQTMMNKNNRIYENDVKTVRQKAKQRCDQIQFIPYYQLLHKKS